MNSLRTARCGVARPRGRWVWNAARCRTDSHRSTRSTRSSRRASIRTAARRSRAWTGVRAIDTLLTIGRGARIGIFGAPGCGKSTLLETIVRGARADTVVIGLIGERGREAQRWIEMRDERTSVICATSDRPAQERIEAAWFAVSHACALASRGLHVLLLLDSLARVGYALRECGAAAWRERRARRISARRLLAARPIGRARRLLCRRIGDLARDGVERWRGARSRQRGRACAAGWAHRRSRRPLRKRGAFRQSTFPRAQAER